MSTWLTGSTHNMRNNFHYLFITSANSHQDIKKSLAGQYEQVLNPKKGKKIEICMWTFPCGQQDYIDQVIVRAISEGYACVCR